MIWDLGVQNEIQALCTMNMKVPSQNIVKEESNIFWALFEFLSTLYISIYTIQYPCMEVRDRLRFEFQVGHSN